MITNPTGFNHLKEQFKDITDTSMQFYKDLFLQWETAPVNSIQFDKAGLLNFNDKWDQIFRPQWTSAMYVPKMYYETYMYGGDGNAT